MCRYWLVRLRLFVAVCLFVVACQKKATTHPPETTAKKGQLILKPVGGPQLQVDPGSKLTLKALATYVGLGPATNLAVDVAFVGAQMGAIGLAHGTTDSQGFITVPFTAANDISAKAQVQLRASGAPSLTFTINIGSQLVAVSFQGKQPQLVQKNTQAEVVVLATNQRGAPQTGLFTTLALQGSNTAGAKLYGSEQGLTDASGQIHFSFFAGDTDATYSLRATVEGAGQAESQIVVVDALPQDASCNFTSECPAGDVCVDGGCVSGQRRCSDSVPCPSGWECVENICRNQPLCPGGVCPSGVDLDISGIWKTRYHFDLSATLGVLQDLSGIISTIDTLFQGKLPVNIPILGPIIEQMLQELIAQYIPDWAPKLASALNDLLAAFTDMNIVGQMDLSAAGGSNLTGEEVWDRVVVLVPSLCPRRQFDPAYPACATVNIQLGHTLGGAGITAQASTDPFVGTIAAATLTLTGRKGDIQFNKLLRNLVDLLVNISTNGQYQTIVTAVPALVDCPDLAIAAGNLACDVTNGSTCSLPWFEGVCNGVAAFAATEISNALDKVPIDWTLVGFTQVGTANDRSTPPDHVADTLDNGSVSGTTNFFVGRPLTGSWNGVR